MTRPSSSRKFRLIPLLSLFISCNLLWLAGCRGLGASPSNNNNGGGAVQVVSFTANTSSVAAGSVITLSWQTQNATQVTIDNGVGTQPPNGSASTTVNATTTFNLVAQGASGQAKAAVTVNVSTAAPTVSLSADRTTINAGDLANIKWVTTNATAISFNPAVNCGGEPDGCSVSSGIGTVNPTQTTTYVATVTGPGGTATGSITITVNQVPPTITLAANPTNICCGNSAVLTWNTSNATSVTIDNGVGQQPANGSIQVKPTATTTYTATATGPGGTASATATVSVSSIAITANPSSIAPGQSTTLSWQSSGTAPVDVEPTVGPNQPPTGTATVNPSSTTTYTATTTDASGNTVSSSVTVQVVGAGDLAKIKHIIFFLQENRSFDNYFGKMNDYRVSRGIGGPNDVDVFNPNVTLVGIQNIPRHPFHERTVLTDNMTPSWNESHFDLHRPNSATSCTPNPGSNCKMDHFMITTNSISEGRTRDPNGDRAVGFYDQTDLPFYYELAAQFATSDRWFSPVLTQTIPNRMYLFAATSFGHIKNDDPPPTTGWPQPTIFDELDAAGISWRYYYLDNSVMLAQFATYTKDIGKVYNIADWYQVLSQPNADQMLPQVIFIERGSHPKPGDPQLDEHPIVNIQPGAANTAKIINALLQSTAWQNSVFIFGFDEGGGCYDHVPPFPQVPPDNIQPMLQSSDLPGSFNESGFRTPFIVISPWVKPHFVSHVNRDNTAILKFIETWAAAIGKNVPALAARDAAQDNMLEFFDFSMPHFLTPPPLPAQPTNGVANMSLETAP